MLPPETAAPLATPPVLAYGADIRPVNLGTRTGFSDIAQTVLDALGVPGDSLAGKSFAKEIGA